MHRQVEPKIIEFLAYMKFVINLESETCTKTVMLCLSQKLHTISYRLFRYTYRLHYHFFDVMMIAQLINYTNDCPLNLCIIMGRATGNGIRAHAKSLLLAAYYLLLAQ